MAADPKTIQRFSIEGIDIDLIRHVRAYAILEDKSTTDIISEALKLWLDQKQKSKNKL